ncbi:MAG: TolC family protein [Candidatus Gastranaerophilales bacterium]|nr:TolC family protein [Candidatus Gastranaerophilales bacterium]MCM1072685.1 TolC family protein [Bacteroides sp.]
MKKILIILLLIFSSPVFASTQEYMNFSWWENFGDELLISNLQELYHNNYDLKNAELKIKENEQIVRMQFANELPAVMLSGNLSRDFRAPRQQFGAMHIPNYSQYNYNIPITAGYEIDIWGKNRLQTKSKKEQLNIIKQAERATCITLSSDFAADYFNLIKADKFIKIQEELIKTQEEILAKVSDKYKAGLCGINELLEQEKLLTSLREEYNIHVQTRDVLISILGVYLANADNEISRSSYDKLSVLNNLPTQYSTDIISNRPDYLQEEANLKRIGFDVRVAKKEFLPTFTIFGQVGLNAYHLSSLFSSPSQFFNAGILPNWDLFSGGRKRAFLKIKKYQYEQALNDYQKTFLVGIKDMNSGLVEYKTSLNNYEEAQKRIAAESKIYDLAKYKNQIGAASDLDILFAKEAYLMIEKEIVSNKINTLISTIGLYKAAGGVNLYRLENL